MLVLRFEFLSNFPDQRFGVLFFERRLIDARAEEDFFQFGVFGFEGLSTLLQSEVRFDTSPFVVVYSFLQRRHIFEFSFSTPPLIFTDSGGALILT